MALHLRSEWATLHPNFSPARKGVNFVVIHHTAGQAQGDVPSILRGIESMVTHQAPGNSQPLIATDYNLLVDPAGGVWEGRGLQNEDAATLEFNAQSVSVCAIGNYDVNQPPPALLSGIAYAIQVAMAGGWVAQHPVIEGHRDVGTFSTACPGRYLEADLDEIRRQVNGHTVDDPAPTPKDNDVTDFLYRDPASGNVYYVAGNARSHVDQNEIDLFNLAAGLAGRKIPDLGNLTAVQLKSIGRLPIVGTA